MPAGRFCKFLTVVSCYRMSGNIMNEHFSENVNYSFMKFCEIYSFTNMFHFNCLLSITNGFRSNLSSCFEARPRALLLHLIRWVFFVLFFFNNVRIPSTFPYQSPAPGPGSPSAPSAAPLPAGSCPPAASAPPAGRPSSSQSGCSRGAARG